jgi:hypothetical protein
MTSALNLARPRVAGSLNVPQVVFVFGILLVAATAGASLAVFGGTFGVLWFGLIAGIALLALPRAAVWATAFGGLVVAGLAQLYLPGLQTVRWAFAGMSIALALICIVKWFAGKKSSFRYTTGTTSLAFMLALFVAAVLLACVASGAGMTNTVVGLKNYFQMWGLMLALAWLGYKPLEARRFMLALALLALIQLPFVLHQFLVLVPLRTGATDAARNVVAVDIVAGTFGGDMSAGGRSANLALLAVIVITIFFAQWKLGYRKLGSAVLLSVVTFAPMLLNEAKLALVLLPLALLLLFREAIVRRPFAWLLGATTLCSILVAIVVAYASLPGANSQRAKSVDAFVRSAMEINIGDRGYGSAVLNRSTVYSFWWQEHTRKADYLHAFFGHGPGFSSSSAIGRGDNPKATKYLGYAIGLTGLSTLLWDTGLIGTGVFLLVLVTGYGLAGRLVLKWQGTVHEPTLVAARIALALFATSLLHNEYVAFDIGYQTMLTLTIGYLFSMAKAPVEARS